MTVTQDRAHRLLSVGLYTQAEAARYARISSTRRVTHWLFGSGSAEPVIEPEISDRPKGDRIVTFRDFVQLLAIRAIRIEKKVSLQKVREALEEARSRYGMEHPFAEPHTTYLFGGDIVVIPPGRQDDLVRITGKKGQQAIKEVAELYMEDLVFGDKGGLASQFRVFANDNLEVRMDPRVHLGQPFLPACRYPAEVLVRAFEAEGGIESAARCYGVEPRHIKLALRFRDYLLGSTAA